MGTIKVHEFTTIDGVIDTPTWTFDYGFTPALGEAIGAITGSCSVALGAGARLFPEGRRGRRWPSPDARASTTEWRI
ncbi:hypothetical protein [Nonomuraea helvata]|uniref:Uncharacterized protein n=1 Tax=Nonomuraea helvata TaxID=37484 RepID=A0ABV5SD00_9ACTN